MGQNTLIYSTTQQEQPNTHDLMYKVYTFTTHKQANQCFNLFYHRRRQQKSYQIQIKQIQIIQQSHNKWKVILSIQFPEQSFKSILLSHKKTKEYLSIQQIFQLLQLSAQFILTYKSYLCNHIDIYTHLFNFPKGIKICHPLLLYGICNRHDCIKQLNKQSILKQILQIILLKKVIEIQYWEILNSVQQIYQHSNSSLLYNLIANLIKPQKNIESILNQYLQMKQEINNNIKNQTPKTFQSISFQYSINSNISQQQKSVSSLYPNNTYLNLYKKQFSKSVIQEDSQKDEQQQQQYNFKQAGMVNSFDLSFSNKNENIRYNPLQGQQIQIETVSSGQSQNTFVLNNELTSEVIVLQQQNQQCENSIQLYKVIRQEQEGRYEGYYKQGIKTGRGKFYYHNGMYYDGYWLDNKKNGEGSIYYANHQLCYHGFWKDDLQHGQGYISNNNYQEIIGKFYYQDFRNVFKNNLWKEYKGMFRQDWIDGEGILTLSNNEVFKTFWNKGIAEGKGQFINLDGQIIKGIWMQSQLQKQDNVSIQLISQQQKF